MFDENRRAKQDKVSNDHQWDDDSNSEHFFGVYDVVIK